MGRRRIENLAKRRQQISVTMSTEEIAMLVEMAKWHKLNPSRLIGQWIAEHHKTCIELWGGPTAPVPAEVLAQLPILDLTKPVSETNPPKVEPRPDPALDELFATANDSTQPLPTGLPPWAR
jgi:hypothetical protein